MSPVKIKTVLAFIVPFILVCTGTLILFEAFGRHNETTLVPTRNNSHIIFIHGWLPNQHENSPSDLKVLKTIFPNSMLEIVSWAAQSDFNECIQRAEREAMSLEAKISAMPKQKRENLILIGHSLGGRIAIRTMAKLRAKSIKIERGIFLASAIPDTDPDIIFASEASVKPCLNFYNRNDYVLRHLYGILGEDLKNALGAYGCGINYNSAKIVNIAIEQREQDLSAATFDDYFLRYNNHESLLYIKAIEQYIHLPVEKLRECDQSISYAHIEQIAESAGLSSKPIKIIDYGWQTLDCLNGWKLQKKKVLFKGEVFRIVDPKDFQRESGDESSISARFDTVKKEIMLRIHKKGAHHVDVHQ